MRRSLLEGDIEKTLRDLSLPMAVGILATMSFNILDTYFVSGLGEDALAALSFTFPVAMFGLSLAIGLGAGTSSVVARAAGRHDEKAVAGLTTDAMTLSFLMSLSFSVIGVVTLSPLFRAMGATETVLPLIREYMVPMYWSFSALIVPMVGLAAIRALGNTKFQAQLMMVMAVINAVLDPLLIYGFGPFPKLGIEGAAYASIIAKVLAFVATFYYLHYRLKLLVNPFDFRRLWHSTGRILHVGVPAMATNLIIPVSSAIVTALVAKHGADAVAGFGVATRIESMSLVFFYALSAVIGPFCGQNVTAGLRTRAQDSQRICARFCLLSGLAVAAVLAIFALPLAGLFSDDAEVKRIAAWYLWMVPLSYGAYGIVMIVNACFNGIGNPMPGVVISAARVLVLLLPVAWIADYGFGVAGIFFAISLVNAVVGIVAYFWVQSVLARYPQTEPAAATEKV